MGYLIIEMVASLAIAFAIGFAAAWLIQRAAAQRRTQQLRDWIIEAEQVCERWEGALERARTVLVKFDGELRYPGGRVVEGLGDGATAGSGLRGKIVHLERVVKDGRLNAGDIAEWQGRYERLNAEYDEAEQRVAALKNRLARLRQRYSPTRPLRAADAPEAPAGARESGDDLKRVSGIGPVFERTLNEMGIHRFEQLAQLTEEDLEHVAARLETFPYRIVRDRWLEQARELAGLS